MKAVQCNELFGGIALKNHTFFYILLLLCVMMSLQYLLLMVDGFAVDLLSPRRYRKNDSVILVLLMNIMRNLHIQINGHIIKNIRDCSNFIHNPFEDNGILLFRCLHSILAT